MTNDLDYIDEEDYYTINEFKEMVDCGGFIDSDGYGIALNGKSPISTILEPILPSQLDKIPPNATHIYWYNN